MSRIANGRILTALLIVVFVASVAHGSDGRPSTELTLSQTLTLDDLLERMPVVHFAIHNPYYGGELKVYRGFYLRDIIWLLMPDVGTTVFFEALDGYKVEMEVNQVFEDWDIVGILAFEEIGASGGFEPFHDPFDAQGRYIEHPGPYWLVWGHIDPSKVSDGGESLVYTRPWPWQLAKIWIGP